MLGLKQAINVRVLEVAKNRNTYFILRKHILLLQFFKKKEIKFKKELERFAEYLYRDTYFVQKLKSLCIFEYLEQQRVITAEIYFKTSKYFSI